MADAFNQNGSAVAIGKVEKLAGVVRVRHPDGTREVLQVGAAIVQGDVVETDADGKVGIALADNSSFSLGPKGSMVMDELVFDPQSQAGALSVSVLKGAYSFVSGHIAKSAPSAMTIKTPVMTIGVRGTSGAGQAGGEGESNSFILLQDPDGTVGEITLTNAGGTRTINQVNFSVSLTSYIQPPPPPVYTSPQQIQNSYGSALSANPQAPQPSLSPPPPPPAEAPSQIDPAQSHGSTGPDPAVPPPPAPPPPPPLPPPPPPPLPVTLPEPVTRLPAQSQQTQTNSARDDSRPSGNSNSETTSPSGIIRLTAASDSGSAFTGGSVDTLFYMSGGGNSQSSTIGGTDVVVGGSASNQIAVDNLGTLMWMTVVTGNNANSGTMTFYGGAVGNTGSTIGTLAFSNIQQFLFSTGNVIESYVANPDTADFGGGPEGIDNDIFVMTTLAANETGIVAAGTSGAETFALGTSLGSVDGLLAFGNGGGDTFQVEMLGNMLLVGGHGSENVDTTSDGIPDADLNRLSFATLAATSLTASSTGNGWGSNGQKGLAVSIGAASSGGLGADVAVGDRFSGTPSTYDSVNAKLNVMAWDIGALTLSGGDDSVRMGSVSGGYNGSGGFVASIDTGAGTDEVLINLSLGGALGALYTGTGDDAATVFAGPVHTIDTGTGSDAVYVYGGTVDTVIFGGGGADTMQVGNSAQVHWVDASAGTSLVGAYILGTASVDTVTGSSGNDSLTFSSTKTALENLHFDGGSSLDTLSLNSNNYATQTTLNYLTNVEEIDLLGAGNTYDLRLVDGNVGSGASLSVDASALTTGKLVLDGSAETNGNLTVTGGGGNDSITGGAGADTLTGGSGDDVLTGGAGSDIFQFSGGTATSLGHDSIMDFANGVDFFQLSNSAFGMGSTGNLSAGNLVLAGSLTPAMGTGAGIIAVGAANSGTVNLYYCDDLSAADTHSYQIAHVDGLSVNQVDVADFKLTT